MPFKEHLGDLIGVGVSAGLTFTFYHLFRAGTEIVHHLKEAAEVDVGPELIDSVRACGGAMDACVRGVVKARDNPIHSLTHPSVSGVYWRHTIKEHLTSQVMGFWLNDSLPLSTSTNSVPFYILRKGVAVQVSDPSMLEGIDMSVVSERFESASTSFLDHVLGWLKGVRTTGTQHTEEMLLEGSTVLGVGRLVFGPDGLCLDAPDTIPYMITTRTKKCLIEDLQAPLPYFKMLGLVTALGGIYCIYRLCTRLTDTYRRRKQRQREQQLLEEARLRLGDDVSLERVEGGDVPENLMCVVCCGLRDVLLLPCRHMCVCGVCAYRLPEPRLCPVCRTEVESVQAVFYS